VIKIVLKLQNISVLRSKRSAKKKFWFFESSTCCIFVIGDIIVS